MPLVGAGSGTRPSKTYEGSPELFSCQSQHNKRVYAKKSKLGSRKGESISRTKNWCEKKGIETNFLICLTMTPIEFGSNFSHILTSFVNSLEGYEMSNFLGALPTAREGMKKQHISESFGL